MASGVRTMLDPNFNVRMFLIFSVALGLIVAGSGNALFCPKALWARLAIASLGCASTVTSVYFLVPESAPVVAAVGIGTLFTPLLTRSDFARRSANSIRCQLRKPRLAWGLLALAGAGLMVGGFVHFDLAEDAIQAEQTAMLQSQSETNPYVVDESRAAKTDRGSKIHLLTNDEAQNADRLLNSEYRTLHAAQLEEYVIRRGPADDNSNCHGWVFTGGKYAIFGHEVDTILEENEYVATSAPNSGDLCIYRNDGKIAHSAIVRSVLDDGTILVEGKWGRLGVFLHPVDRSCYGTSFGFYHTARHDHLLANVP